MRQWPSTHRPTVMLPWNPCGTTSCLPIPSNPRKYWTQIRREWARVVKYLGIWQDRGSKKTKGPKTPSCCEGKWRAIRIRWQRHVLARKLQEMGMIIIPRINERSTFTFWISASFFLIEAFWFRVRSVLAYVFGGKVVRGNFFSLTVGRTFTFRQWHGRMSGRQDGFCVWVKVLEGGDAVKKGKVKGCFMLVTWK